MSCGFPYPFPGTLNHAFYLTCLTPLLRTVSNVTPCVPRRVVMFFVLLHPTCILIGHPVGSSTKYFPNPRALPTFHAVHSLCVLSITPCAPASSNAFKHFHSPSDGKFPTQSQVGYIVRSASVPAWLFSCLYKYVRSLVPFIGQFISERLIVRLLCVPTYYAMYSQCISHLHSPSAACGFSLVLSCARSRALPATFLSWLI